MTPALVYAPGERYVLAHRVPVLEEAPSTVTACRLPIGDDWKGLPPDACTPICVGCSPPPSPSTSTQWAGPGPVEPEEDPPAPSAPTVSPEPAEPVRAALEPSQPLPQRRPAVPPVPYRVTLWRLLRQLWRGHR